MLNQPHRYKLAQSLPLRYRDHIFVMYYLVVMTSIYILNNLLRHLKVSYMRYKDHPFIVPNTQSLAMMANIPAIIG